jgi:hypothetical protein
VITAFCISLAVGAGLMLGVIAILCVCAVLGALLP